MEKKVFFKQKNGKRFGFLHFHQTRSYENANFAAKIEQANTLYFLLANSEPGSPAIAMRTTVMFLLYFHDLHYSLYIPVKRTPFE